MIIHVSNLGERKGLLTIDRIVVSMTPKIEKNNYSDTTLEVVVLRDFLILKVWCKNIWFEPQSLAGQITGQSIILGQRIQIVGQSFWDGGSITVGVHNHNNLTSHFDLFIHTIKNLQLQVHMMATWSFLAIILNTRILEYKHMPP